MNLSNLAVESIEILSVIVSITGFDATTKSNQVEESIGTFCLFIMTIKNVGRDWAQVSGNTYCHGRQFVIPHKEGISRMTLQLGLETCKCQPGSASFVNLKVRWTIL